MTTTMKATDLVLDFDFYPRSQVDSTHVGHLAEALRAGNELPAVIVEKASKRVVDGFHRYKAYVRVYGKEAEISVDLRSYRDEGEMFIDAITANARHGCALSPYDRVRCIAHATAFGLTVDKISDALALTVEKIGELTVERTATTSKGEQVTLKQTARHLRGQKITKKQRDANEKAGGMTQAFYVNQVVNLIEGDLLDWSNEYLWVRLIALKRLMVKLDIAAKVAA